jgi:hypothetical protein
VTLTKPVQNCLQILRARIANNPLETHGNIDWYALPIALQKPSNHANAQYPFAVSRLPIEPGANLACIRYHQ